jgi:hypothetical protein
MDRSASTRVPDASAGSGLQPGHFSASVTPGHTWVLSVETPPPPCLLHGQGTPPPASPREPLRCSQDETAKSQPGLLSWELEPQPSREVVQVPPDSNSKTLAQSLHSADRLRAALLARVTSPLHASPIRPLGGMSTRGTDLTGHGLRAP